MKNVFITLLTLLSFLVHSQDPHFSQFNEHPSLINPALTGANDPLRVSAAYKDQWRSVTTSYQTYGASFETRFKPTAWQKVDNFRSMTFKQKTLGRLATGLSIYRDKAGDANLNLTQANLSLASFVPTGRNSFLSAGLQASIVQRKIDNNKLVFPEQYNGSGYDANMASGESFGSQNFIYPDFAGGFLYSFIRSDKKITGIKQRKANIGISVYHVNRPSQKYLTVSKDQLYSKYVLHGDFLFDLTKSKLGLAPSYLIQFQGSNKEILAGMLVKYYMNIDSKYTGIIKRNTLSYGAYYRNNDAAILHVMLEWQEQYAIGLSYDANISGLKSASFTRGGMEISLRYTPPKAFLYQMKNDQNVKPQ